MLKKLLKFIREIGAAPGMTFHVEVQDGVGPVIFPNSALTRQSIHTIQLGDCARQATIADNSKNR